MGTQPSESRPALVEVVPTERFFPTLVTQDEVHRMKPGALRLLRGGRALGSSQAKRVIVASNASDLPPAA